MDLKTKSVPKQLVNSEPLHDVWVLPSNDKIYSGRGKQQKPCSNKKQGSLTLKGFRPTTIKNGHKVSPPANLHSSLNDLPLGHNGTTV